MNGRVLVAYGSKSGSTAEIAEAIGMELRLHGLDVTVDPAGDVRGVRDYEFVVLGSALYAGRWRHSAMAVLKRERKALMARQVWLFQSGLSVIGPGPWKDPTPAAVLDQWRKEAAAAVGRPAPRQLGDGIEPTWRMWPDALDPVHPLDVAVAETHDAISPFHPAFDTMRGNVADTG